MLVCLTNVKNEITDIEVDLSQDHKEPTEKLNNKKVFKRHFLPKSTLKFSYGESKPSFLEDKKF